MLSGEDIDWTGAAISAGIGAAEGALTAACPAYAVAISATSSAIDSIIDDARAGESVGTIITNGFISAGFGAITGGNGNDVLNADTINAGRKLVNNMIEGYRPLIKKNAKKGLKKLLKKEGKKMLKSLGETIAYDTLEEGTQWFVKSATKYYSDILRAAK